MKIVKKLDYSITADDIVADPIVEREPKSIDTSEYNLNPKLTNRYDYRSIKRPEVDFPSDDPNSRSLTNQSDKDGADINIIMSRYEKTGLITDAITGNTRKPMYGDFTVIGDYYKLQNTLVAVNRAFSALTPQTRNRFQNDPAKLIEFLSDPANDQEAISMGLKPAPEIIPPDSEAPPAGSETLKMSPKKSENPPPDDGGGN